MDNVVDALKKLVTVVDIETGKIIFLNEEANAVVTGISLSTYLLLTGKKSKEVKKDSPAVITHTDKKSNELFSRKLHPSLGCEIYYLNLNAKRSL